MSYWLSLKHIIARETSPKDAGTLKSSVQTMGGEIFGKIGNGEQFLGCCDFPVQLRCNYEILICMNVQRLMSSQEITLITSFIAPACPDKILKMKSRQAGSKEYFLRLTSSSNSGQVRYNPTAPSPSWWSMGTKVTICHSKICIGVPGALILVGLP